MVKPAPIVPPPRVAFDADGVPDTTGLPADEIATPDGAPYMRRYYLWRGARLGDVRLHQLLATDPQDMHDHPWDFVSLILAGCYLEHTPDGAHLYRAPALVAHAAEDRHRLELPEGEAWSYVVTGPPRRQWGYHTAGGWVHWQEYGATSATSRAW